MDNKVRLDELEQLMFIASSDNDFDAMREIETEIEYLQHSVTKDAYIVTEDATK